MSTRNVARVLRGQGRLSIGWTDSDFTGTFPYGGTALGWSMDVMCRVHAGEFPILAAEWGGVPVEVLKGGEWWSMACIFRAWDPDAIETTFPNTRTGAKTADPVVQLSHAPSGGTRAGQRLSTRAVKLVFTPDDLYRVPAWCAYRAVPVFQRDVDLVWDRARELAPLVTFLGMPDTTAELQVGEIGPLVDLAAS